MHVISELAAWQSLRKTFPASLKLGFVPTMGNLHPGHLSLCKQSQAENDLTIVSIFVNPTQFNNPEDLTRYPKTLEADLQQLERLGVNYCFIPHEAEIYADGYQYRVDETGLALELEGKHRPGHFTGVLTVLMKLFHLIKPHAAYFGEKDYQQYALVKGMIDAFFMDISIKLCPTIREMSGLAYSSRNQRLSEAEKKQAELFASLFRQAKPIDEIRKDLIQAGIQIDYLETVHNRRYIAVHIGSTRLIDNYLWKTSA